MVCIALLRSINIGGHNVTMERLRHIFAELGLKDVRSYIQTGNIFFDIDAAILESPEKRLKLTEQIQKALHLALGYEVPVMLRSLPELEEIVRLEPFKGVIIDPSIRLCVLFLSNPLAETPELLLPYQSAKGDYEILCATSGEAFVVLHQQAGKPVNAGASIEKLFNLKTTTRFYHTTLKIIEAAKTRN